VAENHKVKIVTVDIWRLKKEER